MDEDDPRRAMLEKAYGPDSRSTADLMKHYHPPEERGFLLPIMKQGDQLSPAMPGIVHDPYEALKRLLSQEYRYRPGSGEEGPIRDAAQVAGAVGMPGLVARAPVAVAAGVKESAARVPTQALTVPSAPAEWSIQAAVRFGGRNYAGANHGEAIERAEAVHGPRVYESAKDGFLINGRFVSREHAGRMLDDRNGTQHFRNAWFGEDKPLSTEDLKAYDPKMGRSLPGMEQSAKPEPREPGPWSPEWDHRAWQDKHLSPYEELARHQRIPRLTQHEIDAIFNGAFKKDE